jgi:hypothetical protein
MNKSKTTTNTGARRYNTLATAGKEPFKNDQKINFQQFKNLNVPLSPNNGASGR